MKCALLVGEIHMKMERCQYITEQSSTGVLAKTPSAKALTNVSDDIFVLTSNKTNAALESS